VVFLFICFYLSVFFLYLFAVFLFWALSVTCCAAPKQLDVLAVGEVRWSTADPGNAVLLSQNSPAPATMEVTAAQPPTTGNSPRFRNSIRS
jgi:hypothetical protein